VITITLAFPKTMTAGDVFQALYDAGAATTGTAHRRPAITAIEADAESLTTATQLANRLAERGISRFEIQPAVPPNPEEP
jgi:hypothetical protein